MSRKELGEALLIIGWSLIIIAAGVACAAIGIFLT